VPQRTRSHAADVECCAPRTLYVIKLLLPDEIALKTDVTSTSDDLESRWCVRHDSTMADRHAMSYSESAGGNRLIYELSGDILDKDCD
jgi:hypothetical protein